MLPVGCHVDGDQPLKIAASLGADCVQIFLSDPQSFKAPPKRHDEDELRTSGLPIYVHAPYRINVCSPASNVRYGSRNVLKQTLKAADRIGAAGVIVHGGHAEDDVAEGFGRWARTVEDLACDVPVLIENTAGGKNAVARKIDDFQKLWETVKDVNPKITLGICIDTCHAHSAGEDLSDVIERVISFAGKIDLLHANDSKDAAGSGRDRHCTLGTGEIDAEHLRHMIKAANAPVICENKQPQPGEVMQSDIGFVREALL
jgi:deoxyribonuclease-4